MKCPSCGSETTRKGIMHEDGGVYDREVDICDCGWWG